MSSLNLFSSPAINNANRRRILTPATAAKSSGGGTEEKSIWDFILGALAKQEQLYETNPILANVEAKTTGTTSKTTSSKTTSSKTTSGKKNTVVVPPKKNDNPFGGFFAKKD